MRFARDLAGNEALIRGACRDLRHETGSAAPRIAAALVTLASRHDVQPEELVALLETPTQTVRAIIQEVDDLAPPTSMQISSGPTRQ